MYGKIVELRKEESCGVIRPDDGSEDVAIRESEYVSSGLSSAHEGDRVYFSSRVDEEGVLHADHIVQTALMSEGNHHTTNY